MDRVRGSFPFLQLPPEIRLEIYEMLLDNEPGYLPMIADFTTITTARLPKDRNQHPYPAIIRTNKFIRDEATAVLYANNPVPLAPEFGSSEPCLYNDIAASKAAYDLGNPYIKYATASSHHVFYNACTTHDITTFPWVWARSEDKILQLFPRLELLTLSFLSHAAGQPMLKVDMVRKQSLTHTRMMKLQQQSNNSPREVVPLETVGHMGLFCADIRKSHKVGHLRSAAFQVCGVQWSEIRCVYTGQEPPMMIWADFKVLFDVGGEDLVMATCVIREETPSLGGTAREHMELGCSKMRIKEQDSFWA